MTKLFRSLNPKTLLRLTFILLILAACNKKRVEEDAYQPLDTFYNRYKQQEQEFTIDTGHGPCLLTGRMGTQLYDICDTGAFLRKRDSSSITYPYKVKLVEIYPVSDMIYWPLPSIASGKILETAASIKVRAFKDADELFLKSTRRYSAVFGPTANITSGMQIWDGDSSGTYVNWAVSTASYLFGSDTAHVSAMGWINAAKLHAGSTSTATITVTAPGTNPQNIGVFVVFRNFKSMMKVDNLVSGPIPVGEQVTLIAFAMNQNNQFLLQHQDITISSNQTIALNMTAISEADLVTYLNGL